MYPSLFFLAVIILSLSPSRGVNGECSAVKRDLAILLDASGSVGVDNFQLAKDFVRDLLLQLPIGPDAVKVSLLTFATQTKVFCWLEDSVSREALLVKLDNVTYDQRATLTHLAFQTVRDQVLTPQRGARPGVADMVVVITDGKSNAPDRTLEAVQRLHQEGVAVVAIGVGGGVDEVEVRAMASHPQLAFLVESYARLASLHQQLFLSACDEKFVEAKTTMGSSPTTEMSTSTASMTETTTPTTSAVVTQDATTESTTDTTTEPTTTQATTTQATTTQAPTTQATTTPATTTPATTTQDTTTQATTTPATTTEPTTTQATTTPATTTPATTTQDTTTQATTTPDTTTEDTLTSVTAAPSTGTPTIETSTLPSTTATETAETTADTTTVPTTRMPPTSAVTTPTSLVTTRQTPASATKSAGEGFGKSKLILELEADSKELSQKFAMVAGASAASTGAVALASCLVAGAARRRQKRRRVVEMNKTGNGKV